MPYTDVIVSLECLNHYNPNLWALAKFKAYQSIKEPFIHVDGDVFIWTKIDESLRDHELIVQNEETTTDYYGKMWRDIRHAISYMPEEMKRYDLHIDNKAYNMGIFGGTDIDFIQRYTYKAFDFVDKNIKMANKLQGTNFNIFFEQVLLYEMVLSIGDKECFKIFYPRLFAWINLFSLNHILLYSLLFPFQSIQTYVARVPVF